MAIASVGDVQSVSVWYVYVCTYHCLFTSDNWLSDGAHEGNTHDLLFLYC